MGQTPDPGAGERSPRVGDSQTGSVERAGGIELQDRQGVVLVLLLAIFVLGGLAPRWAQVVEVGLLAAVFLLALWVPGLPPVLRRGGAPLAAVLVACAVPLLLADGQARGAGFLLRAAVGTLVLVAIVARIAQHSRVTRHTVFGAFAAYALIGFVAAAVYQGTDLLTTESFLGRPAEQHDYAYFSFTTLTTTGYGDFAPATALGKRMVMVEVLFGQIFLVTVIARLVSLWGQPLGGRSRAPEGR